MLESTKPWAYWPGTEAFVRGRDRTMSFLVRLIRVLYLAMYFHLSTATSIDFCMRLETTCAPCRCIDRAQRNAVPQTRLISQRGLTR